MGEFLITMGLGKGAFVTDFGFENVKLKWKAKKGHNNDCGVFVMIHQLLYCGEPFECDLGRADSRALYRGEISACLIMCELNNYRSDVLEGVKKFALFKAEKATVKRKSDCVVVSANKRIKTEKIESPHTPKTPTVPPSPRQNLRSAEKSALGGSRLRGKDDDGLGWCLVGMPSTRSIVVSQYLRASLTNIQNMSILRKDVADYLFLNDHTFDRQ